MTELSPDLVVVHLADVGDAKFTLPPLHESGYVLAATSTQPVTVSQPFTVTITPADLTKGLIR